jgi:hypothetical protein
MSTTEIAPSPVSDEIENELSQLSVRHPTTVRSRFVSALRFLIRPESMTAYATLAAAFAAFLSLRAAERQEKATFTSALYTKQVDATATIVAQLETFARAFPGLSPDGKIDYHIHATDSDFQKAYVDYQNLFCAINTITLTYPKKTEQFVRAVRSIVVVAYRKLKTMQDLDKNNAPTPYNIEELRKVSLGLTNLYMDLFTIVSKYKHARWNS